MVGYVVIEVPVSVVSGSKEMSVGFVAYFPPFVRATETIPPLTVTVTFTGVLLEVVPLQKYDPSAADPPLTYAIDTAFVNVATIFKDDVYVPPILMLY